MFTQVLTSFTKSLLNIQLIEKAAQVLIFVLFVIYLDLTIECYKNRAFSFLLHVRVFQNFLRFGKKRSVEHKHGLLPNKNTTIQV